MEAFLQLVTSPYFISGCLIFLACFFGAGFTWWIIIKKCKRKVCAYCGNPTRDKDDQEIICCNDCRNKQLLKKTREEKKTLDCPDCKTRMNKRLIEGTTIIIDSCPLCNKIALDKEQLDELTILDPAIFYEEEEKKDTEI